MLKKSAEKKKNNKRKIIIISSIFVLIIIWTIVILTILGDSTVETTYYDITEAKIPKSFDNYKIVQISDLHSTEFGDNNSVLLDILKSEKPDIIAITGDLANSGHDAIEVASTFAKQAAKIADCYYITGECEALLDFEYEFLEEKLKACGVIVLHNQSVQLEKNGETIQLSGVDDPVFLKRDARIDISLSSRVLASSIKNIERNGDYTILLSHRPEAFETYVSEDIDLVLSGHVHGGQIRLPLLGGLIALEQGIFPKYDAGMYSSGSTTMIVSRGIGNSIIPVRLNNRPEVVVVRLHKN